MRGEDKRLSKDEIDFNDALAENESAVEVMGKELVVKNVSLGT